MTTLSDKPIVGGKLSFFAKVPTIKKENTNNKHIPPLSAHHKNKFVSMHESIEEETLQLVRAEGIRHQQELEDAQAYAHALRHALD